MKLTLPTGTELHIHQLNDVLNGEAPGIAADALVVSADALRAHGALERLARKLKKGRYTLVAILGPEAEQVHDALDELLIGDGAVVESLPTTTWHSSDEEAADILNMVEQMVRSSDSGHEPPTILVIPALALVPTDVQELLRQLNSDLGRETSD